MHDFLTNLRLSFRQEDLLDVAIVAFIVYRLLNLIRGTRAVQMLIGLGVLTAGFFLSSQLELYTTHWLLSNFFDYFVFIIIVLFQDDLRRALTRMGKNPFLVSVESEAQLEMVDEVARAATQMARDRIGALMVIERETGLKNFMDTGSKVDARVRAELLYSVFLVESPLHDGAVIITGDRLASAGCFLPLSKNPDIDRHLGTRHRAAIGLTEETDAVVVLVSEEAGQAHIVQSGEMIKNLSETQIRDTLTELLNLNHPTEPIPARIKNLVDVVRGKERED
ncbi:MAG: TIGR00159 family protein [Bdellovibrionales bacterium]|nr:TIGR00159 family protein [Oligoflexia bacterium]